MISLLAGSILTGAPRLFALKQPGEAYFFAGTADTGTYAVGVSAAHANPHLLTTAKMGPSGQTYSESALDIARIDPEPEASLAALAAEWNLAGEPGLEKLQEAFAMRTEGRMRKTIYAFESVFVVVGMTFLDGWHLIPRM
jgi:hypothetical protein